MASIAKQYIGEYAWSTIEDIRLLGDANAFSVDTVFSTCFLCVVRADG
jgi:hypothetical protein